jgi:hypothetical protein
LALNADLYAFQGLWLDGERTAIRHINLALRRSGYGPIKGLDDLLRYRDQPQRAVPVFSSDKELETVLVNHILKHVTIPELAADDQLRVHEIGDSELNEITGSIDLATFIGSFTRPSVESVRWFSERGWLADVSDSIAADVTDRLLQSIDFPIRLNYPDDDAVTAILGLCAFDSLVEIAPVDAAQLRNYRMNDVIKYVNAAGAERLLDTVYCDLGYPLVSNAVGSELVDEILTGCAFLETCRYVGELDRPSGFLHQVSMKDLQVYSNDRVTTRIMMDLVDEFRIPLQSNLVQTDTVTEIAGDKSGELFAALATFLIDPLWRYIRPDLVQDQWIVTLLDCLWDEQIDDIPISSNEVADEEVAQELISLDWADELPDYFQVAARWCLTDFRPVDMSVFLRDGLLDEWFDGEFADIVLPLARNLISEALARDIAHDFACHHMPPFPFADIRWLTLVSLDRCCHCSIQRAYAILGSLFDAFDSPLSANAPSQTALVDIVECPDVDIRSIFPRPPEPIPSLRRLAITDLKAFVNSHEAEGIIPEVLIGLEGQLPIASNAVSAAIVDEVSRPYRGCAFDWFPSANLRHLQNVDPIYRRIDFGFPVSAQFLSPPPLPLVRNVCSSVTITTIIAVCEPFEYLSFTLDALDPLLQYPTPKEGSANFDILVAHLINMILKVDVLPACPVYETIMISHKIAFELLSGLYDQRFALESLSDSPATRLQTVCAIDVPVVITPDELVARLLWDEAFLLLPLTKCQRKTIDDFIDTLGVGDQPDLSLDSNG